MSFVITVWVPEGIVMAADSRLTLSQTQTEGEQQVIRRAIPSSDTAQKLFSAPPDGPFSEGINVGISTFGDATIGGNPIAGTVQMFIKQNYERSCDPSTVADELLGHFKALGGVRTPQIPGRRVCARRQSS